MGVGKKNTNRLTHLEIFGKNSKGTFNESLLKWTNQHNLFIFSY